MSLRFIKCIHVLFVCLLCSAVFFRGYYIPFQCVLIVALLSLLIFACLTNRHINFTYTIVWTTPTRYSHETLSRKSMCVHVMWSSHCEHTAKKKYMHRHTHAGMEGKIKTNESLLASKLLGKYTHYQSLSALHKAEIRLKFQNSDYCIIQLSV